MSLSEDFGRFETNSKELWQVSATGLVIGCLIAAASFYLKAHDMAGEAVPVLAVVGILVRTPNCFLN